MHDRRPICLLDLDGFVVLSQTIEAGGRWLIVETTADVAGYPSCGVVATGHGRSVVQVRDLTISGTPVRQRSLGEEPHQSYGGHYHPERFSSEFDRRLARCNRTHPDAPLRRVRLHDLRRTWASLALQAGDAPEDRGGSAGPLDDRCHSRGLLPRHPVDAA